MEISDISTIGVRMPVQPLEKGGIAPYVTNHGQVETVDRILVRVETDDGRVGWGEMRPFLSPEATVSVIQDGIAPLVVGRSPFELEGLRRQLFIEYTNVDMFFAPVEMACWDIVGKTLERPVFELLGGWTAPVSTERQLDPDTGTEPRVEVAYCLGILSPEESAIHAERAVEQGYSVLKTKAGQNWQMDIQRIKTMHEAVDGDLSFRLDPNQGWRFDEAVRVGAALEDEGIYLQYLEQPIQVNSHKTLAKLRNRTRQPIAPNEDTYIKNNLRSLINHGSLDIAVVDMTPAGGITGLRQIANIAEDANVPVVHHCAFDLGIRTAAILHAVYGIPGFDLPPDSVYYAWEEDILENPLEVKNGSIAVPEDSGFGITIDESKVCEYSTVGEI